MLLVTLLGTICTIGSSFLSAKVGIGFSRDLRKKVFEKVESFSLTEVNEIGTASLITRTTNDINQIQMVTIMMMRMMLSSPLIIIGALIMAFISLSAIATAAATVNTGRARSRVRKRQGT